MGFGIYEQMGRTPTERECPACGLTERKFNERADALSRVRKEIDDIDADIISFLVQRLAKARYARYLHPEYVDDYERELSVMAHYSKHLVPWTKASTVADLCMALFRMSRP